jgi:hypothetical protein
VSSRSTAERPVMADRTYTTQRDETKLSLLSTEFWAFIACATAILAAAYQADNFDAPRAWTLIAAVTVGYMVSRGLAKAGSAHRSHDDRG